MVLGRVAGAHGLAGWVRVRFLGDGPENLFQQRKLWLAESEDGLGASRCEVRGTGLGRAGEVRVRLDAVDSRDAAQALRGRWVLGEAEQLSALPEGDYYWHELIGCRVESSQGRKIGRVVELLETGAHDLLVVEAPDGRRHLLPTAAEFMHEVDLAARRIVIELIPGLLD